MLTLLALPHPSLAVKRVVPRRPVPNYDGRAPAPRRFGEIAAWGPRVVLYPFRLVFEGVRWPLDRLFRTPAAFRIFGDVAGYSTDLSTTSAAPHTHWSVLPLLVMDLGRRVNGGLAVDATSLFSARNRLSLLAATGGSRFYVGEVWDRVTFVPHSDVGLRLVWWERPDNILAGPPGPDSGLFEIHHFWMRRAGGAATVGLRPWTLVELQVASGIRFTEFELRRLPFPPTPQTPDFDRYTAFFIDADLLLDSRGTAPAATTGVRLAAWMRYGFDLDRPLARRWVVGGAALTADLVVLHPGRVLGAEVQVAASSALGKEPVPFPELPIMGGAPPMRGFLEGFFRGATTAAVALHYRWPIWVWMGAETRIAVGNSFGPGFEGFRAGALYGSWDLALRAPSNGFSQFEALVGLGTNRFDRPTFEIDHVRLLFSLTRAF